MCTHSQHGIQHQHALLCPLYEITVVRDIAAKIIMQLLVNIYQRRRDIDIRLD